MLQSYSILASLFHQIGNHKRTETCYIKYIQLIERFYLKDSVETSNAYFLIGVYYFEQKLLHKAAACFQKCLAIRQLKLGRVHTGSADCLLNLGIIYKKLNFLKRAKRALSECISIRREGGSETYSQFAHALEEYGKLLLLMKDYSESFKNFKKCY